MRHQSILSSVLLRPYSGGKNQLRGLYTARNFSFRLKNKNSAQIAAPMTSPHTAEAIAAVPCQSSPDPAHFETERMPSCDVAEASGVLEDHAMLGETVEEARPLDVVDWAVFENERVVMLDADAATDPDIVAADAAGATERKD